MPSKPASSTLVGNAATVEYDTVPPVITPAVDLSVMVPAARTVEGRISPTDTISRLPLLASISPAVSVVAWATPLCTMPPAPATTKMLEPSFWTGWLTTTALPPLIVTMPVSTGIVWAMITVPVVEVMLRAPVVR